MPTKDTKQDEAVKPVEAQDTVTVKKSALDAMIARLERLEASASKAALQHFDDKNPEEREKHVRIRTIDGKAVISWDAMVTNVTEKNERGVWYEDQKVCVHYEDGTEETMPYVFFARRHSFIRAKVVSETRNMEKAAREKHGDVTIKAVSDDGVEYEIGSKFIN